jgi:outer membrane protein assembly factor BamD
MKKLIIILTGIVLLASCGEFQKVYNGDDVDAKYKAAWKYYEAQKYSKADQLFSQIDRFYKRKPQYQRLLFAHAMSLFKMKYYVSAGEKFRKFTQLFPESSRAEEADYYIVLAYDALSPKYSVDQSYTVRALEEIAAFLKKHPFSKYKDEVNDINKKLQHRLEKKYFEIAKLYYDLDYYKAAITALNNYLVDYPGSDFKEDALYYRFRSAADLALNSVESKKKNRLQKALEYYDNFSANNQNEIYAKKAEKIYKKLQISLNELNQSNVTQNQ